MNLDVDRFLEDLTGIHARAYTEAVGDLLVALAGKDAVAARSARLRLTMVISETMGISEVLGATMVLRDAAKIMETDARFMALGERLQMLTFADEPVQSIIPRVTFDDAVRDMIDRTPVTIRDAAERTAQNISKLYSEGRVTAFVNSAEQAVTERVQSLIGEAIQKGIPEINISRSIVANVDFVRKQTSAWTEGYARMAFRTNLNTAVTAGRFRQVQDPDIRAVIPAFRFDSVGDADTRDNHDAADGLIMSVDDKDWNRISPPLGYNCRCQVSLVGTPELRRMGMLKEDGSVRKVAVPTNAFPDDGFRHGGRADLIMNEASR